MVNGRSALQRSDVTNFKGWPALWEHFMALFSGRASMLEVQNRALIKTAGERAERISDLERELQRAVQEVERLKAERKFQESESKAEMEQLKAEMEQLKAEMEQLKAEMERLKAEMERLKAEREFYHNRVLALEQHNREVTEAATQYSLWGQSLERQLAKLDPAGARAREFGAWSANQAGTLKKR
jgi:DNA repair exonuclease SbcCD ATPase subunit